MLRRTLFVSCVASKGEDKQQVMRILAQRRAKWVDRRQHKIHHNGKEVWHKEDQPACALCHVRFRYKQDYQTHKDTQMHKDRVRWVEMCDWYKNNASAMLEKTETHMWDEYVTHVVEPQASKTGADVAAVVAQHRRARLNICPTFSAGAEYPSVKSEILEPRDQRWPAAQKH